MNTFIFLRHAETKKDPDKPAVEWGLADEALRALEDHVAHGVFANTSVIVTSTEPKAIATAAPLSTLLGVAPSTNKSFNEVARGTAFLSDQEFLNQKRKQLTDLDYIADGSESGRVALQRFILGVQELDKSHTDKTILIVTHGTIMSIYFASLLDRLDHVFERWSKLLFCAVGIVADNKVVRDII